MSVVARLPLEGHCMGRPIKWYRHVVVYLLESDTVSRILYEVVVHRKQLGITADAFRVPKIVRWHG
jgi:hypothetical protein